MAEHETTAFILRDEADDYYAIPPEALAAYRVPAEHREAVARLVAEAAGADTVGFGQGQGQDRGLALGRGHGGGNPHTLQPLLPTPLPLPFPTITDGTSNTILFGER